jgi:hypothetical protein
MGDAEPGMLNFFFAGNSAIALPTLRVVPE